MSKIPKILFFDSGLGGLSVFREVYKLNPQCAFYYLFDHACFPYGNKSENFLKDRVSQLFYKAIGMLQPDMAVVACNTASTIVLPRLREEFSLPIVGVVPAIKPAAKLSTKKILGLLATPGTVARAYTEFLINEFAYDCKVLRLGTEELVRLAESYMLYSDEDPHSISATTTRFPLELMERLSKILEPFTKLPCEQRPDVVVLGCTHFPLLRSQIHKCLGADVALVDSGAAIAHRVQQLLLQISAERLKLASAQTPVPSHSQGHPVLAALADSASVNADERLAEPVSLDLKAQSAAMGSATCDPSLSMERAIQGANDGTERILPLGQDILVNPQEAGPKIMLYTGHLDENDSEMLDRVCHKFGFPVGVGLDELAQLCPVNLHHAPV